MASDSSHRFTMGKMLFRGCGLHYTPTKQSLRGYTVFSMSVIPSFCHSVIPSAFKHLSILLYNLDSFCPILFIFTSQHHCQTMHVWSENRGWRISITRVMPLCKSFKDVCIMTIVILSTLRVLLYNFDSFCLILFVLTPYHYNQTMHVW